MSFFRSVSLLFALVCAVLVPVFVGHGLASHGRTPFVIGAGLFVVAAVAIGLLLRGGRERGARDGAGMPGV